MTESKSDDSMSYAAAAWMRGDGTGYFFTCPVCHFFKNGEPGSKCRRIGCSGTVIKVELLIVQPTKAATSEREDDE